MTDYSDDELDFILRRASLEQQSKPDASDEFQLFMRRNTQPLSDTSRRKAVVVPLWLRRCAAGLSGVACILLLLFICVWHEPEKPALATGWQEETFFVSAPQVRAVSVKACGMEFPIGHHSAEAEGITMSADSVIQVAFSDDSFDKEPVELLMPEGTMAHLKLDDGSDVWLGAQSRLVFPARFYKGQPRRVKLVGEAYFRVVHDASRPFIVDCGSVSTTVLGTEFCIKAYDSEAPRVTLVSGKVRVENQHESVTLLPNQQLVADAAGALEVGDADMEVALSWKEGAFYYDGQTLREILSDMARWYDMDLKIGRSDHLSDRIHFACDRQLGIAEVVGQLSMITSAKISIKGRMIMIN